MIIADTTTDIETSGMGQSQTFGMQQSKKAFKILSGLYSDIHLAIVRELGCNAADSHKAINKATLPFHIHLPNDLEPWITIEDFGSGIAHKDIYDIYAVYFASTKANTNRQIGCTGLGSKSPCDYTDPFTVHSTINAERRIDRHPALIAQPRDVVKPRAADDAEASTFRRVHDRHDCSLTSVRRR